MATQNKEEDLKSFLKDTIGMEESVIEDRAQELIDNDEVLLKVNAYEKIKEENVAQPQDSKTVTGAYIGYSTRTNNDGEIMGYETYIFSEDENEVAPIRSDENVVGDTEPQLFTEVSLSGVQQWEDLEDGYTWLQSTEGESEFEVGDDSRVDMVIDWAQSVDDITTDGPYLVFTQINDVDLLGNYNEETDEFGGWEPIIEDRDNSNLRLKFRDQRTNTPCTLKIKDPEVITELCGPEMDLDRLLRLSANSDNQEMRQQLRTVLEGEEVLVFGRGSLYVNESKVQNGDGEDQPWLTHSNFEPGFIKSLTELEE